MMTGKPVRAIRMRWSRGALSIDDHEFVLMPAGPLARQKAAASAPGRIYEYRGLVAASAASEQGRTTQGGSDGMVRRAARAWEPLERPGAATAVLRRLGIGCGRAPQESYPQAGGQDGFARQCGIPD